MNLEDWAELKTFESIIPCTTPTWALWAADGEPLLARIVAWEVIQEHDNDNGKQNVWASCKGLVASCDGVMDAEVDSNFVGYLDESELPTAQVHVVAWMEQQEQAKARKEERARLREQEVRS